MTEERLTYLFLKYLDNTCTFDELQELFSCTNSAKTDDILRALMKKVYEEIRQGHPSFTYVDRSGTLFFDESMLPDTTKPVPKKKKTAVYSWLLVVALAVIGYGIWRTTLNNEKKEVAPIVQSTTKKFTERKEQKFLLLPDSTQVWLNSASSLEFPDKFAAGKREVNLTGEAFFDVKHADKIPFIIHTGKITTTVLGTAFNIKAYQDQKEIIVSVTRGKVKVSRDNATLTTLTKGQIFRINLNTEKTIQKELPVETISSWQQGELVYDEMALDDIVKDLQNVFNVQVQIRDSVTANLNITASFNRNIGPERAVEILARLTRKKFKKEDGILILE